MTIDGKAIDDNLSPLTDDASEVGVTVRLGATA